MNQRRSIMRRLAMPVLLILTTLVTTTSAFALDPNKLFNRALDLAKDGQTVEAVKLWIQVLVEVEPRYRPSVHRALGMAYAQLEQLPEAIYHLEAYLDTRMEAESTKTREFLTSLRQKAAASYRPVTIACDPASANVYLDGVAYECPLVWWFPTGKHTVVAKAVGYKPGTLLLDLDGTEGQTLFAVKLESTEGNGKEAASREEETLRHLKDAAANGHTSVLRTLALDHPEVFRDLACDIAWKPALKWMHADACNDQMFELLLSAGVEVCGDSSALKKAAELGCLGALRGLLEHYPDDKVVGAVWTLTAAGAYRFTVDSADRFLAGVALLRDRLNQICERGGHDASACKALLRIDEELAKFYRGVAGLVDDSSVIGILALRPEWTAKYRCLAASEIARSVNSQEQCVKASVRLGKIGGPGQGCAMGTALVHEVRSRCLPVLKQLLPRAVPEDLALASLEFNSGDHYMPGLIPEETIVAPDYAVAIGTLLLDENARQCKKLGPDSANCDAARKVETQLNRIKKEALAVKRPATLLKELCLVQKDLDHLMDELAQEKRFAELSGAPNRPKMQQLAVYIVPMEKRLALLARRFKELGKKAYSPKLCQ